MSDLDGVLARVDIVRLIRDYVPTLELVQHGKWRGPCPFHRDTERALFVHPGRRIFQCFGEDCREGGDALKFLMRYCELDFHDAATALYRRALEEADGL